MHTLSLPLQFEKFKLASLDFWLQCHFYYSHHAQNWLCFSSECLTKYFT